MSKDSTERSQPMTAPPKTREEWYDNLLHLSPEYSEDVPRAWAETLDSIMSLQAEVERLRTNPQPGSLHAVSEIIMDAVSWHVQHFPRQCLGDIGPEAFDKFSARIVDEIEKARQPK